MTSPSVTPRPVLGDGWFLVSCIIAMGVGAWVGIRIARRLWP